MAKRRIPKAKPGGAFGTTVTYGKTTLNASGKGAKRLAKAMVKAKSDRLPKIINALSASSVAAQTLKNDAARIQAQYGEKTLNRRLTTIERLISVLPSMSAEQAAAILSSGKSYEAVIKDKLQQDKYESNKVPPTQGSGTGNNHSTQPNKPMKPGGDDDSIII